MLVQYSPILGRTLKLSIGTAFRTSYRLPPLSRASELNPPREGEYPLLPPKPRTQKAAWGLSTRLQGNLKVPAQDYRLFYSLLCLFRLKSLGSPPVVPPQAPPQVPPESFTISIPHSFTTQRSKPTVSTMTFAQANLRYKGTACKVPGCTGHRETVGSYCRKHHKRNNLFGHPLQFSVLPKAYATELSLVTELIQNNMGHPGIRAGIEFFKAWLVYASTGEKKVVQPQVMKAVGEAGVKPEDLLAEVAAIVLLSQLRSNSIKDEKATRYCYARAILRHAGQLSIRVSPASGIKRKQIVSATVVREIATYIHDQINPLLLNLANTVQAREAKAQEAMNAQYRPIPY